MAKKAYPYGIEDLVLIDGEYQSVKLKDYHDPDYFDKAKEELEKNWRGHFTGICDYVFKGVPLKNISEIQTGFFNLKPLYDTDREI